MSDERPQRWLDDEGLDESLRTDLERAAVHDVGYDVEAGLARFEATLAQGPAGSSGGGGGAAAASGGKGLVLVIGAVLAIGAGVVAWSLLDREEPAGGVVAAAAGVEGSSEEPESHAEPEERPPSAGERLPEPEVEAEPGTSSETAEPVVHTEPVPLPEAPVPESKASKGARASRGSRASASSSPASSDDDRLRREMQATDRARQALTSDPARALRLAKKAEREFAGGLFSEDREGISILALFGLGRDAEARRRAAAFLRAHPRSSHADRIRAAMAGAEAP